jgi:rsbT antagonist protein RsbS
MERIPILKMGEFLLVSVQVDMHDRLALALQDDLTERIVKSRARGVLIDISSLEVVDSFIGRTLANIASMSRVLDAETVVVGMRPAVAITLVELGMSLTGVRTALDVERGMALLRASLAEREGLLPAAVPGGGPDGAATPPRPAADGGTQSRERDGSRTD